MMDNPMQMMRLLKSENGVETLMKQPVYENEFGSYSQAELLADVINILRMDAKRLGAIHGVDLGIEKIEPDRIAWILGEMVQGHTQPMVDLFNGIEDLHHEIMAETLDDETFQQYLDFKESQLYTLQPDEVGETEADQPDPRATNPDSPAASDPPKGGVPADFTLEEFERQMEAIKEGEEFADIPNDEAPNDE